MIYQRVEKVGYIDTVTINSNNNCGENDEKGKDCYWHVQIGFSNCHCQIVHSYSVRPWGDICSWWHVQDCQCSRSLRKVNEQSWITIDFYDCGKLRSQSNTTTIVPKTQLCGPKTRSSQKNNLCLIQLMTNQKASQIPLLTRSYIKERRTKRPVSFFHLLQCLVT